MTHSEEACGAMKATLKEIDGKVDTLPHSSLTWRPKADVWSILDNLCHIEEFIPYWTGQVVAVIAHPGQPWGRTHSDPDRLAAVADTTNRELANLLARLHNELDLACRQLLPVSDKELETCAPSRNPRWGVKPASFILDTLLVKHLAGHCAQIQRNIDQMAALAVQPK